MGEFDHIPAHTSLPEHTQAAHVQITKLLSQAADIMAADYECDATEAWLRLAAVTKRTYERVRFNANAGTN